MKFMCLGYFYEPAWNAMSKSEQDAMIEACFAYDNQLREAGHWLDGGAALQGSDTAKTLRWIGGKVTVTDGPFTETKELLGGAGLLEARNMEQAVELMSRHPSIRYGFPFEIRPIDEQARKRQLESDAELQVQDGDATAAQLSSGAQPFACLGYVDENYWESRPKEELDAMLQQCIAFDQERRQAGQWISGIALQGPQTAKTVLHQEGRAVVIDGPYAETKEWLGGLVVLGLADIDQAVALLSQHPALRFGVSIEIRPIDQETEARWEATKSLAKRAAV